MAWSFKDNSPVSLQIANYLRLDIVNGKYKAGEQIPTVRQLAFDASVNPNTVQKSLSILESEGLLVSRSTLGRFVTEDEEIIKNALLKMQEEYLERVFYEAQALKITNQQFLNYIEERKDNI